jgi:hypothetical protein
MQTGIGAGSQAQGGFKGRREREAFAKDVEEVPRFQRIWSQGRVPVILRGRTGRPVAELKAWDVRQSEALSFDPDEVMAAGTGEQDLVLAELVG